jgi:phage shock protein PspC (stress-responsive transcriptional regulator)
MNKTVTINLSGFVFHINEDAYSALQAYLNEISNYIAQQEGAEEMLADIESRIAELLQTAMGQNRQVVDMNDVNRIREVLGNPADFATEGSAPNSEATEQTHYEKIKKRLFRNPDDQVLGGVCSGLGAYLDVDTTWVRLAMVLLVSAAGLSIWVYLVLWLVIPIATTAADRYAMRGEPGNLENIMKNFQEEAKEFGKRQKQNMPRYQEMGQSVLNPTFKLMGVIVGAFLLLLGIGLLAAFLMSLLGIGIASGNTWMSNWRSAIVQSSDSYVMAICAYILLVGIPIAMLIYAALKLMLRINYRNRWLNASLSLIWLIGLGMAMYVSGTTLMQFKDDARIRETSKYAVNDTISIKMNNRSAIYDGPEMDEEGGHTGGYFFTERDNKNYIMGMMELIIVPADNDSLSVTILRTANGSDSREANRNAKGIEYTYTANNKGLLLDDVFIFPGRQFRMQEVEVRVSIPIGTVVSFDRNCRPFIDEAENVSHVWPGKVAGRRWLMTSGGLKCIDCQGLESEEEINVQDKDGKVLINKKGIYVDDENAKVSIDANGIRVVEKERVEKKANKEDEK